MSEEEIMAYVSKNIVFYEPVYHVFNMVMEMDRMEQGNYQTVDNYDVDSYYLDELTNDKFASKKGVMEHVREQVNEK